MMTTARDEQLPARPTRPELVRLTALLRRASFELRLSAHMIQTGEAEVGGDVRAMIDGLRRNLRVPL